MRELRLTHELQQLSSSDIQELFDYAYQKRTTTNNVFFFYENLPAGNPKTDLSLLKTHLLKYSYDKIPGYGTTVTTQATIEEKNEPKQRNNETLPLTRRQSNMEHLNKQLVKQVKQEQPFLSDCCILF